MKKHTYEVTGAGGTRIVEADSDEEARHLAMVQRWGDISDNVVPRGKSPYRGEGLSVTKLK